MIGKNPFPWPGLLLAAGSGIGMLAAGVTVWLVLSVLVVWFGTLWLSRPEPPSVEARERRERARRDNLGEVIEPVGLPLILFDGDRIVAANAAARTHLGAHIVGQDGRIALRHPQAVKLLDMEDGASVTINGLTGPRSLWQLTRGRIDERYWLIELDDRTTEADISRAHTDFVANASHELRTPLAAVIGYVETLAESPDKVDTDTVNRFHGIVLREARRMQSLVADLMSLSQLEADKHDVPINEVDLAALAARVTGEFTATIGNARLSYDRPSAPMPISGDSKQLEQLLRNLIDNALKYGDPDKPVTVALAADGKGRAKLSVTDRGAGIATEHLPFLTRRFYRTDPGRSRAGGGTGLGLAIVKHVVERHKGQLDISSTEGVGTTVCATLPLRERSLS